MSAPRPLVGRTTLTDRALRSLVTGLTRDIGEVGEQDVSVTVRDAGGDLALAVELPFVLHPGTTETLPERGSRVRDHLVVRTAALADRRARTVDVRFTAVHRPDRKKVT